MLTEVLKNILLVPRLRVYGLCKLARVECRHLGQGTLERLLYFSACFNHPKFNIMLKHPKVSGITNQFLDIVRDYKPLSMVNDVLLPFKGFWATVHWILCNQSLEI